MIYAPNIRNYLGNGNGRAPKILKIFKTSKTALEPPIVVRPCKYSHKKKTRLIGAFLFEIDPKLRCG